MEVKTKTMLLFWQTDSVFSNWYQPAVFEWDGHRFLNSEAGMMYQKAKLFGDQLAIAAILQKQDPRAVKQLGRGIKGYDEATWVEHRERLVFEVCLAKFQQNPVLKAELLATKNRQLVEASPLDRIWGIGLAPDDPAAQNPSRWRGLNLLGKVLMAVREQIKREE